MTLMTDTRFISRSRIEKSRLALASQELYFGPCTL